MLSTRIQNLSDRFDLHSRLVRIQFRAFGDCVASLRTDISK